MTRKDYELIAKAMKAKRAYMCEARSNPDWISGHDYAAGTIADALAIDNPRFDRAKFLKACGVA